jgi:dCMP deaminase
MNIAKLKKYMKVAESFAAFSPDAETKVGSILISKRTGSVISQGYNGFVRGAQDDKLPTTRPEKHDYVVHAEQNMIYNAAYNHVGTSNCIVVCTLSPCKSCLRAMWQSGIDEIYFKDTYKDFKESVNMGDLIVVLTNLGEYSKISLRSKK